MPGKNEVIGNEGWAGNSEALKIRGRVAETQQSRHASAKYGKKDQSGIVGSEGRLCM